MKKKLFLIFSLYLSFFFLQMRLFADVQYGLAAKYSGTQSIKYDKSVIFTEDFEEPNLDSVAARWDDVVNLEGMSLVSDVPLVSSGIQSIQMTSIIGQNIVGFLGSNINKALNEERDSLPQQQ